jgi:prolyl oligopeptidase
MDLPVDRTLPYPPAPREKVVEEVHGLRIEDPYRWAEDPQDSRTREWSAAQHELFQAAAARWQGRKRVVERLRRLQSIGAVGVPVWRGERKFFLRRTGEQEHVTLLVARPGPDGTPVEQMLLDPMAMDPRGLTTLDAWQPSRDGGRLAYQVSEGGTEESVLRVLDVGTGTCLDGPIDRARYSPVAWLPDGDAFYYVRRVDPAALPAGEEQYHRRVWLHRVGSDPSTDVMVFGEGLDLRTYFGVGVSRDGRWLVVSASTGTAPREDVWIADLSAGSCERPDLRPLAVGLDAQISAGVGRDGRLYVGTDLDAPRGRLVVADPSRPGPEHWKDLIAEDPEAVLESYTILDGPGTGGRGVLVVERTRHAVGELTVHDLSTGEQLPGDAGRVPLPGPGSVGSLVSRPEGGHEAWFSYTDHATPSQVHRFDARTGVVELAASPPGLMKIPQVVTRQVLYRSTDGTPVRMFVIAREDVLDERGVPRGPRPTLLYGYGGFGISLTPGFSPGVLTWTEAGGIYAVANLRGGAEEGEQWHRDGMLGNKQHVFDDFHCAAEYLIDRGWTTADHLAVQGGSNGGLLVGAALTQRPELFAAVVCSAPLLDMVRYEKFGLGATWNVEYGSADAPEQLGWLLGYSPYHRVEEGTPYPAVLFTVFEQDTRVDPLHARKLCAALQHATASARPILLRAESDVGHGARSVSRGVELAADTLAFLAHRTGLVFEQDP